MSENHPCVDDQNPDISVDGIPITIEGEGPEVLLMVHGWPDTAALWDLQVAHLRGRYRCVRFTLPGFDVHRPRQARSLVQMIDFIARVADAASPAQPLTLMLHDWGCLFGWQYARLHPRRVARIVAIDVGDAHSAEFRRGLGWRGVAMIATYQLWLAAAWRLGALAPRLADGMTRWMARRLGCRSDPARIGAQMNYPYDITWTGSHGGYRGLPPLVPHCPVFYAYAERKPVQFQSAAWLARIAAAPGNRVQAFDCGHWVMRQRAQAFNAAVEAWLQGQAAPAEPGAPLAAP